MGIYVNPGNEAYTEAVNSMIYVDKTGLIAYTNRLLSTVRKFLCVSRPRRFGKSMAADMLCAYYSRGCDSEELFHGKMIETEPSFAQHRNRHSVIRFDVQRALTDEKDRQTFIQNLQRVIVRDLMRCFPDCSDVEPGMKLSDALDEIYSHRGERFVFIVDEWDCVFRFLQGDQEIQKRYLDFLRGLFKGAVYVDLVYMTGILPIKKYGEHSALNMFDEYSITDPKNLETLYGFTSCEVKTLCATYEVDYSQMEKWYDGYQIGASQIYNPKSVVDALTWKKFRSYWTGTETYEALKRYIDRNDDGLREAIVGMLGGIGCPIDPTTFQNDMTTFRSKDDVLTLLVHLGYLTYNEQTGEVTIPNQEIAQEFERSIRTGSVWGNLAEVMRRSESVLEATWKRDGKTVADGIAKARQDIASIIKYNDENALSFAVCTAYSAAQSWYLKPVREMPSGRGYIDLLYLPRHDSDKPALVIELKKNVSAEGAIRQIKERNYTGWVQEYTGNILLVGINYDQKRDRHDCVIEAFRAG